MTENLGRGVIVPVCTPLTATEQIDRSSLQRLLDHLVDGGVWRDAMALVKKGS